jgi:hypothetical protein
MMMSAMMVMGGKTMPALQVADKMQFAMQQLWNIPSYQRTLQEKTMKRRKKNLEYTASSFAVKRKNNTKIIPLNCCTTPKVTEIGHEI